MDKLELFNKIKLAASEFYKNNPCKYCVGNGCDDCRGCSDAETRYQMETYIYNLKKQYKELYGSDYDEDYIDSLRNNPQPQISNPVMTSKEIIKEWFENNMAPHSDWTGTRIESKNEYTMDQVVESLFDYLVQEQNRV